jgi:glycosyltransferase involved in cell wall biosynthesis
MSAARARGYRLRLVIRGQADLEGQHFLRHLHRLVAFHKLEDDVAFEGAKEGMNEIYGGLDLVVVPSSIPDPLPRSVMEAMSLGIPVAGYPAGGILEMISDRKTGWLIKDEQQFIACLDDLQDDRLVATIANSARAHIDRQFSIGQLHTSLSNIYETARNAKTS